MLEKLWLKEEREEHFSACFGFSMIFALISIVVAHFFLPFKVSGELLTGLIAVVLTSLVASYPLIKYLEEEVEKTEEEERKNNLKDEFDLLERHETEAGGIHCIFIGCHAGFWIR